MENKPHYHTTEDGWLVQCYHKSRAAVLSLGFWVGLTIGFPLEHLLWEKVWPFKLFTHWMGL